MVESGTINDPVYDQNEIMSFCSPRGLPWHAFLETNLNIQNRQLCRQIEEPGIEPPSTFCVSERYITGLNSVELSVVLTTTHLYKRFSQLLLSYVLSLSLQQYTLFSVISDSLERKTNNSAKAGKNMINMEAKLLYYCRV